MVFNPQWHVFTHNTTREPDFMTTRPSHRNRTWWRGLMANFEPLLEKVKPTITVGELKRGEVPAYGYVDPDLPQGAWQHHTVCVIVGNCHKWLRTNSTFKLKKVGKHANSKTSKNRGYIWIPPFSLEYLDNQDQGFYLHQLLCYMYRGPPGNDNLEVCHRCHCKLCIIPWHMQWGTPGDNIQQAWDHKKHVDYAPSGTWQ